ncbi:hypothetical protein V8G54_010965, partial [Vigna mungo]
MTMPSSGTPSGVLTSPTHSTQTQTKHTRPKASVSLCRQTPRPPLVFSATSRCQWRRRRHRAPPEPPSNPASGLSSISVRKGNNLAPPQFIPTGHRHSTLYLASPATASTAGIKASHGAVP